MNAGRGIEQLIAQWLVEEAASGAPDRVLDSTRQVVNRTNQRRFAALWRDPMFSPMRAAVMAAALAVALVGGVIVGRLTAPSGVAGPGSTPTPSETQAPGVTIAAYRADRNAICKTYLPQLEAEKPLLDGLYDPALSTADRAPKVAALGRIVTVMEQTLHELDGMDVPADLLREHEAQLGYYRSTISLLNQALDAIGAGDLVAAEAIDLATDPNSRAIEAFESKHGLAACP